MALIDQAEQQLEQTLWGQGLVGGTALALWLFFDRRERNGVNQRNAERRDAAEKRDEQQKADTAAKDAQIETARNERDEARKERDAARRELVDELKRRPPT